MSLDQSLNSMTVPEKLELMETVWASLCQKPTEMASPAWHEKVLAGWKRRLEAGEIEISPWNEAKKCLQDLGRRSFTSRVMPN